MRYCTGIFRMVLPALIMICPLLHPQTMVTAQAAAGTRRMLVVYRNGAIPGDAEGMAARAGGRVLHRHERLARRW